MKTKYLVLLVVGFLTGLLLSGCDNNREKKVEDAKEGVKEAQQDLKVAKNEYEKEWLQFKSDAEAKILSNQKIIDEFKLEIKTASSKFRVKYEKEIYLLEQKNIELRKKISEYKYEGKDKWEEFKKAFNNDMNLIGDTINDLFNKKE